MCACKCRPIATNFLHWTPAKRQGKDRPNGVTAKTGVLKHMVKSGTTPGHSEGAEHTLKGRQDGAASILGNCICDRFCHGCRLAAAAHKRLRNR